MELTTYHNLLLEDTEESHVWITAEIDWIDPETPGVVTVTDEDGDEIAYFDWKDNDQSREAQAVYDAYDSGEL